MFANTGGAGRDRTGDLLSANQALSQLSYSPFSGQALLLQKRPAFEINRGQLDTGARDIKPPTAFRFTPRTSSGDPVACSLPVPWFYPEEPIAVYGMERLPPTRPRCTLKRF